MFYPQLFISMRNYSFKKFFSDVISGIIVGIVALPLAIAFGIASGVSPEKGIITAIIGGFIVSFLGGSKVQIGGPTGAFIVIVYSIIQNHGIEGLMIATFMSGIILVIMGIFKFGGMVRFIPYPVIVGFTSGIAIVIFSGQIKDVLGLKIIEVPSHFFEQIIFYTTHIKTINFYALLVSILTIFIIVVSPKLIRKIPGTLIAIIFSTVIVKIFDLPVDTIGSRCGVFASNFSFHNLPDLSYEFIQKLIQPAFTIAILGSLESLLSASVADGMTGSRHNSDTELISQGIANSVASIFGGIPVTGAIARTVVNIKNGGNSPVAGIVHSITLFLIFLFFGKYALMIPMPCLAGVLVVVSYNMSEWRSFKYLLKGTKSDILILLSTFSLTVIFDLIIAIETGLLLSFVLVIRRLSLMSKVTVCLNNDNDEIGYNGQESDKANILKDNTEVYEINGPFFFGITNKFDDVMNILKNKSIKTRILRMRKVPFMDATAVHYLEQLFYKSQNAGIKVVISGINDQPLQLLKKTGLFDKIGENNIYRNFDKALENSEF